MNWLKNTLLAAAVLMLMTQGLLFTSPGRALARDILNVVITNILSNPVPVRDLDNRQQPFQNTHPFSVPSNYSGRSETVFMVPAGKQLIIEYASAYVVLLLGDTPDTAELI